MKLIKNFLWLVWTFIWSQLYIFVLLILLVLFILFVIVSVKIAKTSVEDYMILLKTLAIFILPTMISLFGIVLGLRRLLGRTTFISKLLGFIILPVAFYIGYKGYTLYWQDFQLAFSVFKVTLLNLWKS